MADNTAPEPHDAWFAMASESYAGAVRLEKEGYIRSALSRYYYAGYQAVTAALLYRGVTPPTVGGTAREAWSHEDTPDVFLKQIEAIDTNRDRRRIIAQRLRELYQRRITADYISQSELTQNEADGSRRSAGFIVKYVAGLLPERQESS